MRLSKFSKKWIAYICAIAMVVAGLAFVPSADTKADAPDWSTISYLGDGAGGGKYTNKYKFYAENGVTAVNIQHPGFAEEDSIYIQIPVAADINIGLDSYDVQGAGACLHLSNFTNKVTEFEISWSGGSSTCYVYYEDGAEGPTTEAPSTEEPSVEPSTEETTETPSVEPSTEPVPAIEFTTAERRDIVVQETSYYAAFVNWKAVEGAAGYKSYIDVEDDDHKAKATTNGHVWSDVNPIYGSTDTWIDNVGTTKDGSVLAEETTYTAIIIAYDSEGKVLARGTALLLGKGQTTEPTSAGDDYTYTNNSWISGDYSEGIYSVYAGIWESGQRAIVGAKFDSTDSYTLPVNVKENSKDGQWLVQLKYKVTNLEAGKSYDVDIKGGNAVVYHENITAESDSIEKVIDVTSTIPDGESVLTLTATEAEPPEPTTDPEGFMEVAIEGADAEVTAGDWKIYQGGTWANAHVGYKDAVDDSIGLKVFSSNGTAGSWGIQVKYKITGLDSAKEYKFVTDYDSSAAGKMFIKLENVDDGTAQDAVVGSNKYEKAVTGVTEFTMVMELSGMPAGTVVDVKSVKCTSEEPSTETPSESPTVEPSTEAPSESPTVEPTTETPTETQAPTQEPTTQAPTQKPTQAPTVAPTTPKPIPVIKIPGKAKVKKAVKKKKSAKKIKVKIKKIKGAKGYQVAVYKTKKKAKKNKKALVKKYTKKTKLTIKSKKFKKKKKLYVKVRAYTLDGTVKVFGAWSKPKKTKKK